MSRTQIILFFSLFHASLALSTTPKYIFLFIADGSGITHHEITELFLKKETHNPTFHLSYTRFPSLGFVKTYPNNADITDSAAAGTAIATGTRTDLYHVAATPQGKPLPSVMEKAIAKKWATAVISTDEIVGATPATFLAHTTSRKNVHEIALQIAQSPVDFIAGGGFNFFSQNKKSPDLIQFIKNSGKLVFPPDRYDEFLKLTPQTNNKIVGLFAPNALPLTIETPKGAPRLDDMVKKGIEFLRKQNKPFFMVAETEGTDSAAHANDAPALIRELSTFSNAVAHAIDFYKQFPQDTLIVVTSDHETGGLGLGHHKKDQNFNPDPIEKSQIYNCENTNYHYKGDKKQWLKTIKEKMGLNKLKKYEKRQLQEIMDYEDQMAPKTSLSKAAVKLIFTMSPGNPIHLPTTCTPSTVVVNRILSARANIFWTTFGHTFSPVPLFAIGNHAAIFSGILENYEIGEKLKDLIQ